MEYKIPQDVRDFIVKYFTETSGLPINYLTTVGLLQKITPIDAPVPPVKKATTPQVSSPRTLAPVAPVERVIPEKATIVRSKPTADKGINNG